LVKKIISALEGANKIGLITHRDGDGDAFGSILAFKIALENLGKKTVIFSNEDLPEEFLLVSPNIKYQKQVDFQSIDVLICLDFNSASRATIPEVVEEVLFKNITLINIDHHRPLDLREKSNIYWGKESASSTCEMVFDLLTSWGMVIPKDAASLLLFGLETDTNSLQNPNTTTEAYQVASELIKGGARLKPVVENALKRKTIPRAKLLGIAIRRLHLRKDLNLIASYVTTSDLNKLGITEDAASGLANFLDQIREAGNIMIFTEDGLGNVKVSMRSNRSGANVAKLAEFFAGGGHIKAAGFSFYGELSSLCN